MRRYETIFIMDPDVSEEQRGAVFSRLADLMDQKSGMQVTLDEWGPKKLAYEIKKKYRGYYVRLDYCGMGDLVDEIERFFRIDDRLLKYMTVVLDKDVDLEQVKQEMTEAEEKAKAAAAEKAEAAARAAAAAEAAAAETAKAEAAKAEAKAAEAAAEPATEPTPEPVAETAPEPEAKAAAEPAPAESGDTDTDQEKEEA